jgi:hypothetical protein
MGLSWPSLHTWICMSVLHEAKDSSHFQSTSTHNNQSISCAHGSQNFMYTDSGLLLYWEARRQVVVRLGNQKMKITNYTIYRYITGSDILHGNAVLYTGSFSNYHIASQLSKWRIRIRKSDFRRMRVVESWNRLPPDQVKTTISKDAFKRMLRQQHTAYYAQSDHVIVKF